MGLKEIKEEIKELKCHIEDKRNPYSGLAGLSYWFDRCLGTDDPQELAALKKEVEDLKRKNSHDKLLNLPLSLLGSIEKHK